MDAIKSTRSSRRGKGRSKKLQYQFPLSTMEAYMKRAGITSAYMKKPCLDPTDPHCPDSAPNKKSGQVTNCLHFLHIR